jgi:hypothetical protein
MAAHPSMSHGSNGSIETRQLVSDGVGIERGDSDASEGITD